MTDLFRNFDFKMLDDPDFREDSVREELVVPLLAALGFSASPPHRIVRSKRLEHPFVYIGTSKKQITIIPDYLLQRDEQNLWVLDAKGPNENIHTGKNVEQAYSYAIHKDVRVPIYALCNGRRLVVFHISQWPAILDVALTELPQAWNTLLNLVGTRAAWPDGIRPGYFPDFGLALKKAGLAADEKTGKKVVQLFTSLAVQSIAKSEDDLYIFNGFVCDEHVPLYIITFDITAQQYSELLAVLEPPAIREIIRSGMARRPFHVSLTTPHGSLAEEISRLPTVWVAGEISDKTITNDDESFCPFVALKFF
jgi:Type I restriction enzyme R protein N terminus (HSDR_N)